MQLFTATYRTEVDTSELLPAPVNHIHTQCLLYTQAGESPVPYMGHLKDVSLILLPKKEKYCLLKYNSTLISWTFYFELGMAVHTCIPVLGRHRQNDQEFKASFRHAATLKPDGAT